MNHPNAPSGHLRGGREGLERGDEPRRLVGGPVREERPGEVHEHAPGGGRRGGSRRRLREQRADPERPRADDLGSENAFIDQTFGIWLMLGFHLERKLAVESKLAASKPSSELAFF